MAGITYADLTGVEEQLARRVVIHARRLVPSITTVTEEEVKKDAVAILLGIADRASSGHGGTVASQSRNGTSISFREIRRAFTDDAIEDLRSLFEAPLPARGGLPVGAFPKPQSTPRLWPESGYSP